MQHDVDKDVMKTENIIPMQNPVAQTRDLYGFLAAFLRFVDLFAFDSLIMKSE